MVNETIKYEEDGPIGMVTLNRPHDGNMFTVDMCDEIRDRIALEIGLVNKIIPDDRLKEETRLYALEVAERSAFELAAIKGAFNARHGGGAGLSRVTHDVLLRTYLRSDESRELSTAFAEKRKPDPDKFGH